MYAHSVCTQPQRDGAIVIAMCARTVCAQLHANGAITSQCARTVFAHSCKVAARSSAQCARTVFAHSCKVTARSSAQCAHRVFAHSCKVTARLLLQCVRARCLRTAAWRHHIAMCAHSVCTHLQSDGAIGIAMCACALFAPSGRRMVPSRRNVCAHCLHTAAK